MVDPGAQDPHDNSRPLYGKKKGIFNCAITKGGSLSLSDPVSEELAVGGRRRRNAENLSQ